MAKFVLAYRGGSGVPQDEAEGQAVMEKWMQWFGSLGEAIVDAGSPFGPSSTVSSDGKAADGGTSALTGYSIITADSLAAAVQAAKGCPVLASGGGVDVYEAMPIG